MRKTEIGFSEDPVGSVMGQNNLSIWMNTLKNDHLHHRGFMFEPCGTKQMC